MEEFNQLKKEVNKDKQPAKKNKITKVEPRQTTGNPSTKKARVDRSTSLKRKKMPLESRDKRNERKNFSRPKTLVSKPEDNGLDAIKNSILKIKEKALSGEDDKDVFKPDLKQKNYQTQIKAHVTVSSINLGNIKNSVTQSKEKLKPKGKGRTNTTGNLISDILIDTFTLKKSTTYPEPTVEPDRSLTGSNEPESYHPSRDKQEGPLHHFNKLASDEKMNEFHTERIEKGMATNQ